MEVNKRMMTTKECTELTKELLNLVASHLSSRSDCKGVNYIVSIEEDDSITFSPPIKVFPNRYRRCERDKVNVIAHVVQEHIPELFIDVHNDMRTLVDTTCLIRGVYEYQSSIDKKRRRWVRTK